MALLDSQVYRTIYPFKTPQSSFILTHPKILLIHYATLWNSIQTHWGPKVKPQGSHRHSCAAAHTPITRGPRLCCWSFSCCIGCWLPQHEVTAPPPGAAALKRANTPQMDDNAGHARQRGLCVCFGNGEGENLDLERCQSDSGLVRYTQVSWRRKSIIEQCLLEVAQV